MNLKITSFGFLIAISYLIFNFTACDKDNSKIPTIEFVSVSKSFMAQGGVDSLYFKFKFTDGDGDIGSDTTDNIFLKDNRTGLTIATYKIPDYLGSNPNNSSRTGEVTLIAYSACCIYPDSSSCMSSTIFPTRDMKYQLQISDRAGNYSNVIESSNIELECD